MDSKYLNWHSTGLGGKNLRIKLTTKWYKSDLAEMKRTVLVAQIDSYQNELQNPEVPLARATKSQAVNIGLQASTQVIIPASRQHSKLLDLGSGLNKEVPLHERQN